MNLEAKIDLLLKEVSDLKVAQAQHPKPEVKALSLGVDIKEIGEITGIKAVSSRFIFLKANGVFPYARGLYRRADVEAAMVRAALATKKRRAA